MWPPPSVTDPFDRHLLCQHRDVTVESLLSAPATCNGCDLRTQNWPQLCSLDQRLWLHVTFLKWLGRSQEPKSRLLGERTPVPWTTPSDASLSLWHRGEQRSPDIPSATPGPLSTPALSGGVQLHRLLIHPVSMAPSPAQAGLLKPPTGWSFLHMSAKNISPHSSGTAASWEEEFSHTA